MTPINHKALVGEVAARRVQDGMVIGLGTGSTAMWFTHFVASRVRTENLKVACVCTSMATQGQASAAGLDVVPLPHTSRLDLCVDGADEFNPDLILIKGGGGAHVREKIVARCANYILIITDSSKKVETLGAFPLPVAVLPWAAETTAALLHQHFEVPVTRRCTSDGVPFITDESLAILDLHFGVIKRPALLDQRLRQFVGVVDTGLFVGIATEVLVAHEDGTLESIFPR